MKDFIKEFGDDQKHKNIPIKFEPADEWGFEPDIKNLPSSKELSNDDKDDQQSFPMEEIFGLFNGNNRSKLLKQKMEMQRLLAHLHNKKYSNPRNWTIRDERELQMVDGKLSKILKMLEENKMPSSEFKNFVTEVVIKYMNESTIPFHNDPGLYELFGKQKEEIVEKIKLNRWN